MPQRLLDAGNGVLGSGLTSAVSLLAVDWGTTALRAALLDESGTVLAERASARGLLSVPAGGWGAVFEAEFGDWLAAYPGVRGLMAGMVGSRQGWAEAPYCACPAGPQDLAAQLLWLQPGRLAIVPGLSTEAGGLPDVMRGEETQVFGALALLGLRDATLVLPGTHSKWVTVQGGRITGFASHMTGECFALFRQHSILARTLPLADPAAAVAAVDAWVPETFDRGVLQAQTPGGLLHHLFSVRSLSLFDRLDVASGASLLSGLVIGEELRAQALPAPVRAGGVVVIGNAALCMRYQRALGLLGVTVKTVGAEATWRGLAALAATLTGTLCE
jgi:2-dehydro-3-deoxygalactonokinase